MQIAFLLTMYSVRTSSRVHGRVSRCTWLAALSHCFTRNNSLFGCTRQHCGSSCTVLKMSGSDADDMATTKFNFCIPRLHCVFVFHDAASFDLYGVQGAGSRPPKPRSVRCWALILSFVISSLIRLPAWGPAWRWRKATGHIAWLGRCRLPLWQLPMFLTHCL